jgi:uncharacterized protein YbaA (DUF1428 family)
MARYVDGFVIPVKKSKVKEYMKIAKKAGKIWMDHGALEYVEAVGQDLNIKMCLPFTKMAKAKPGETVMFSFIVYKSRAHRDAVNKKVMADKRMAAFMTGDFEMPFDMKKMAYGGFQSKVDLSAKKKRRK